MAMMKAVIYSILSSIETSLIIPKYLQTESCLPTPELPPLKIMCLSPGRGRREETKRRTQTDLKTRRIRRERRWRRTDLEWLLKIQTTERKRSTFLGQS
jgi:hypothetical protein